MIKELIPPEVQKFIRDHEQHDPFALVLQAERYPDLPVKVIAEQIRARQKAKSKLPGWYRTEGIIFPSLLSVEQCSSEVAARFKSSLCQGKHLVDLTGGAGVDTYYLSQSFDKVDYIEKNEELTAVTQHNLQVLGAGHITTYTADAEYFLQGLSKPVDCIYLDPARRNKHVGRVFKLEDCTPDVTRLADSLVAKAHTVIIKTSPMLDIEAAIRALKYVCQVYAVAVNNECKEVLYVLRNSVQEPEIVTVNLQFSGNQKLAFYRSGEANINVSYSQPLQYLYEPNAAILKAGAFKSVAQVYNLKKLHPHTHLYTSSQLVTTFPGRAFTCEAVTGYSKKEVQKFIPERKANITVRNFPDPVSKARKKLGLAEGGDLYLFLSVIKEKPRVIITRKCSY